LLHAVFARVQERGYGDRQIVLEPGRSLAGNAGLLITRVEYIKDTEAKNFLIVDAAMNDLIRPTLYDAYHGVLAVVPRDDVAEGNYDVVGPICESGDWLARNRDLAVAEGDYLAIESAGAYGMVMAGNYNTRPRAAEVMVDGDNFHVVRARETVEQLFAQESTLG
jgi:diaminopimelate decarboxylase